MINIYEILLGIDKIERDDSKFQIGMTEREKLFINIQSKLHFITKADTYVS